MTETPIPRSLPRAYTRFFTPRPGAEAILLGLALSAPWFLGGGPLGAILSVSVLARLWGLSASRPRYRYGFLFALAYFAPLTSWLGTFVGGWTHAPLLGGSAWAFVAVGLSLPLALVVPLGGRWVNDRRIWAIPLLWLALELFRSYAPVIAFPWGLLAHPLAGRGAGQLPFALLGGELGAGVLLVGLSCVAVLWPKWQLSRQAAVLCGATVGLLVAGNAASFLQRRLRLTLAAYQPGLDLAYGPYAPEGPVRRLVIETEIAEAGRESDRLGADLVVLPEGLIAVQTPADLPALQTGGTLLLGGQRHDNRSTYQTAFAYAANPQGPITDIRRVNGYLLRVEPRTPLHEGNWHHADKTRLVIFGEFVPGRGTIPYPPSFALPGGDLSAASELQLLPGRARDGREFQIGPILCFEALFPDIAFRQRRSGADVLAVMSLDDWFQGTMAPKWLLWSARWRAAETGLPLVRVGSLGRTEILDGAGNVQASLPWGQRGAISWTSDPRAH